MTRRPDAWKANAIDLLAAALMGILSWPFPIMRALLPVPVHVVAVLGWIALVAAVYAQVSVWRWRRTVGMHFYDLELPSASSARARAAWAAAWFVVAFPALVAPTLLGDRGLPARVSGLQPVSTEPRDS